MITVLNRPFRRVRCGLLSVLIVGAVGCAGDGNTLSRLTDAWADQTMEVAGPAVAAALVNGALAVEACAVVDEEDWLELEPGEALPISSRLNAALGEPQVGLVEDLGDGAIQMTVVGVQIMDRESASMRFVTSPGAVTFGFESVYLDGKLTDVEVNVSESFGRVALSLYSDCPTSVNWLEGQAVWTDLDERVHTVVLPADSDLSTGVSFELTDSFVPSSGTLSWEGRVDGQERGVTTNDAADVSVQTMDSGQATVETMFWPGVAHGSDWIGESSLQLDW